jgi:hypothetical protein
LSAEIELCLSSKIKSKELPFLIRLIESPLYPPLIVICGATAIEKSVLTLQLAQRLERQIPSTDSRQIYHELDIGTAKTSLSNCSSV